MAKKSNRGDGKDADRSWDALQDVYRERGVVLALGAGVSVGSRLPDWLELLRRVAQKLAEGEGARLVDDLRARGFSLPVIAGMLRTLSPDDGAFYELVRASLYRDFPDALRDWRTANGQLLVNEIREHNPTLRAVAAFCARASQGKAPFKRNWRVHAIINTNIDALLRTYAHARYTLPYGAESILRTVERASKAPDPDRINIYHVHGYLRFDAKHGRSDKEASDQLVLSEQEFFDFFNSPTSIFNYAFLYLLREHPCVFMGLSMQDDNIRRLLHYSVKERVRAYRDDGLRRPEAIERSRRHFSIMRRFDSQRVNELVERSLNQLGVNVLWVAEYVEIPERLGGVYGAAGHDWADVY